MLENSLLYPSNIASVSAGQFSKWSWTDPDLLTFLLQNNCRMSWECSILRWGKCLKERGLFLFLLGNITSWVREELPRIAQALFLSCWEAGWPSKTCLMSPVSPEVCPPRQAAFQGHSAVVQVRHMHWDSACPGGLLEPCRASTTQWFLGLSYALLQVLNPLHITCRVWIYSVSLDLSGLVTSAQGTYSAVSFSW